MSATDVDAIVEDYFKRLDTALSSLPRARREELTAEITEHLNEARATDPDETEVGLRKLLDRIGQPEDIAAEALADQHPRRRRKTMMWSKSALALVVAAAVVGIAIGRHDSKTTPNAATSPPTTTTPTAARCAGVMFPIQTVSAPACATFGKPVTLGGIEVTLGKLRAVTIGSPGQLGRNYFCGNLTFMNTSSQSQSYGGNLEWSTASISPQGVREVGNAAHAVLSDAVGTGKLTPGSRVAGSVCFAGTAKDYPGHLVVTWLAPNTAPLMSAAWIGVVSTRTSRSDRPAGL